MTTATSNTATAPLETENLDPSQTVTPVTDLAALTDLSVKSIDLANTVSHLPFVG